MGSAGKQIYNILYTTSFDYMSGGGQWSLYYLVKHLDRERFRPIVLCPGEGELAEKMREAGAEALLFKTPRIRNLDPLAVRRLISIIKRRHIALVHTDSTTETFYAGLAAKFAGIPLVWHIRTSDRERLLDRLLVRLSAMLILCADALRARFEWLGGENARKLATIHNGIDLDEFDAFTAAPPGGSGFGSDRGGLLLACVGRVEKRKGQEYILHAIRDIDNTRLLLLGKADGKYPEYLKSLCAELGISSRVIFGGHRQDIPSVLKGIDIMVFPVVSGEAFSRAVLEAMAAGKPVIATDVGGNPEAVAEGLTGYIVPARDSAAIAAKVNELAGDKAKMDRMGLAGRRRVEELFTIKKNVEGTERLYLDLLEAQDRRHYHER